MAEIEFFGNMDKTRDGNISGQMPSWYFDVHLEKMEESVSKKKRLLLQSRIPQDNIFQTKNEIEAEEKKIAEVRQSKPTLKGGQKDMVYKAYQSLEQQIKESMPTRREDKMGFVSPRDELERLNDKHISIDPAIAKSLGITATKGKISGKDADRCYKMMGKVLGENVNIERIRREGKSESYRTMEDLTQKILEKVAR